MVFAGCRWRVTDTPMRLRDSIWAAPFGETRRLYGWRIQATDSVGQPFVFDVFKGADDGHSCRD